MEGAEHRGLDATRRPITLNGNTCIETPSTSISSDELLRPVIALLARGRQELDALHPLLFGERSLTGKAIQVSLQRPQNLARARIRRVWESLKDLLNQCI